ncbi:LOW QUALITY PROTEIN: testis-specific gene 10 protein [Cyanocitta cristata]
MVVKCVTAVNSHHFMASIMLFYKQSEIKQGRSPSRLDAFIKSLEKDCYKYETVNLLKGVISDPGVLKMPGEREELESTLKIYECHVAEIQGNFKVLTAESNKTINLYEQVQEESSQLHQEVIKCPRTPKSTVIGQAVLRHMEMERDTALSDFRMPTARDSLREQVQISQETAFNEKAHLEQRIEELETTVHNLDSEQLEQMCKVALMKDNSLETEMKRLTRKAVDSETELSQEAEYVSLSLLNEKTLSLSETQSLVKKNLEMQLSQEKIMLLGEKAENFSRQSLLQEEDICALKEAIAQLNKEKSSLQGSVEEGRERIATSEESLAIKENISDFKILISELEHSTKKSAESLREKGITSLHQQLQETNKVQTNKNRESLAQENNRLQEHLSNIKQEIQVLYKKPTKYQILDDMKLKAQDTVIFRLKHVLKSENCELLENYHKAREQGESWEAKCHEAETGFSCYTGTDSETELLREQLGNERASMKNLESVLVSSCEKAFWSQRAKQEKDSEIQFLKEQLALVENNLAVQNQDFTHLRNRAAQLESELGITKTQLGTELFDKQVAYIANRMRQ